MCTYMTQTTEVRGSGYTGGDWIDIHKAIVAFDHPSEAPLEHALCIDFRSDGAVASAHITVELDDSSARRLAEAILATLDAPSTTGRPTFQEEGTCLKP